MQNKLHAEFREALRRKRHVRACQGVREVIVSAATAGSLIDGWQAAPLQHMHDRLRVFIDGVIASSDYLGYHAAPSDVAGSWLSIHVDMHFFLSAKVVLRADRQSMPGIQVYNLSPVSFDTFRADAFALLGEAVLDSEERERVRGYAPPATRTAIDGFNDGELWARGCTVTTLVRFCEWAHSAVPHSTWGPEDFWQAFREKTEGRASEFSRFSEKIDGIESRAQYVFAYRRYWVSRFWNLDPYRPNSAAWLSREYLDGFVQGARQVATRVASNCS